MDRAVQTVSRGPERPLSNAYRHEALIYSGLDDFLQETLTFIEDGITADEPVLVVLDEDKIDAIQFELGPQANPVMFADMTDVGANPGRIIGRWHGFLADHRHARAVRGIGEPIYAGRSPAVLEECQLLESLLNVAFPTTTRLMDTLPVRRRVHCPTMSWPRRFARIRTWSASRNGSRVCATGRLIRHACSAAGSSPVPGDSTNVAFGRDDVAELRHFIARYALDRRFVAAQVGEIEIVVSEIATNAIQHGGGQGIARVWEHDRVLYFEIEDRGWFTNPLAGRIPPGPTDPSGRGLWIANQLCDLLQIRNHASGTVVRAQFRRIGSA